MKLSDFRDLLDQAVSLLGPVDPGRVELSDGIRTVRVGRTAAPADESTEPTAPAALLRAPMTVRAPALGVVILLDNRSGKPLTQVGQAVRRGDVLAFISATDVTTRVLAPSDGRIESVQIDDGDGVEYDAPLFVISPAVD